MLRIGSRQPLTLGFTEAMFVVKVGLVIIVMLLHLGVVNVLTKVAIETQQNGVVLTPCSGIGDVGDAPGHTASVLCISKGVW